MYKISDLKYKKEFEKELAKENKFICKKEREHIIRYSKRSIEWRIVSYFEKMIDHLVSVKLANKELKKSFKCKLFWIDKDVINAKVISSKKYEDVYYIGLYKGLTTKLIEQIRTECKRINYCSTEIPNFKFVNVIFGVDDEELRCSQFEKTMISLLYFYIVLHEVGHIICGHQKKPGKLGGYKDQNKELCADLYGFYAALSSVGIDEKPIIAKYFGLSSYIYCTISAKDKPIKNYFGETKDHPHPHTRFLYMFSWIKTETKKNPELNKEIITSILPLFCKTYGDLPDGKQIGDFELEETKIITSQYGYVFKYYEAYAYYSKTEVKRVYGFNP